MADKTTTKRGIEVFDGEPKTLKFDGGESFDLISSLAEIERHTESLDATEWELLAQFCAKIVMRQVASLDPIWARMIDAARIETGRADWQLLGSWVARVLQNGTHINAPDHPYFRPGAGRVIEAKCEWTDCGNTFKPEFPGQRFCSPECGTKNFNAERDLKRQQDEAMAKAIQARRPQRPIAQVATKA